MTETSKFHLPAPHISRPPTLANPPHPVDALKFHMERAGLQFDSEREAEWRAFCNAPATAQE